MKLNHSHNILFYTLIVLALIAGLFYANPVRSADPEGKVARVVWHVDFAEPRRFSAMLTSIYNMVTTYENELMDYDVRIVLLSHGIRFVTTDKLKGTPFEEDKVLAESRKNLMTRLNSLREVSGVKLALCEITRAAVRLDKDKIMQGVELVPSGVVEVARLQSEGFSYLKAY
jgi:intracellular sulfur oxidation DsrE/DsrF family protein